VNNKP